MARTSAKAINTVPTGTTALVVTSGGSAWTPGSWVELIASAAADTYILGITAETLVGNEVRFEFGTGTAGNEVFVCAIRIHLTNSGSGDGPSIVTIPTPFGPITAGTRISARVASPLTSQNFSFALLYYEDLDDDCDNFISVPHTSIPENANGVTITPNSSAWANSSWVELDSSLAEDVGITGLAWTAGASDSAIDIEFDLGTGSGGAETVITTLRTAQQLNNAGRIKKVDLPAMLPVAGGQRLAIRMRKSGTSTADHLVAVNLYSGIDALGGAVVPFVNGGLLAGPTLRLIS